jgi:uncharacterized protein YabE (DUF348 family)
LRIRRAFVGSTAVALIAALAGTVSSALASPVSVTLDVNGSPRSIQTTAGDVSELLAGEGIRLSPAVRVQPSPASPLADGMTVVVSVPQPASPGVGVWVVEGATGGKVAAKFAEATPSAVPAGSSPIVRVRAVVAGKVYDVLTNASTVGELLSAMGIAPGQADRVLPPPGTPLRDPQTVHVGRTGVRTVRKRTPIGFGIVNRYVGSLRPGELRVVQHGSDGTLLTTYRVKTVNGAVVSRDLLSRRVVSPATQEIVDVGRYHPKTAGAQLGNATWYDAPGSGLTAASPWLAYGTRVHVTDVTNGRSVTVVIDDRGPFGNAGRIIDLSPEAFSALAPLGAGVLQVRISW